MPFIRVALYGLGLAIVMIQGLWSDSISGESSTNSIKLDANFDETPEGIFNSTGFGIGTQNPAGKVHVVGDGHITEKIGIDVSTPLHDLHIGGSLAIDALTLTSNTTLSTNSFVVVDMAESVGNITLTLPSANTMPGRVYHIKKSSSDNVLRISGNIDNYESLKLVDSFNGKPHVSLAAGTNQWYLFASSDNLIGCEGASSNLVAHWKLDEADVSGQALDSTSNNNHMTYFGTMTNADVVNGKQGNALDLDGTDDYLRINPPSNFPDIGDPITMGAWVNTDATGGFRDFLVINNATLGGGSSRAVQLLINGTEFFAVRSGGTTLIDSNFTVTAGVWYHVMLTWDGTTNVLYINGKQIGTSAVAHNTGTADNVWISTYNGVSEDWDGKVDDIRVYNRALSAKEIKEIYECTRE